MARLSGLGGGNNDRRVLSTGYSQQPSVVADTLCITATNTRVHVANINRTIASQLGVTRLAGDDSPLAQIALPG
jgi:hypothetical protein